MAKQFLMGLDFGTDSVRAVIVDSRGKIVSSAVHRYTRWAKGLYSDPRENRFRQHPADYLEGTEKAVKLALAAAPAGTAGAVKGIGIDTTGSTPAAVDRSGTPLALLPEFRDNPSAMFLLWKDHTAVREAEEINALARSWGGADFTKYCGGIYSSEWFWSKIVHVLRTDPKVAKAAFSWVEHCDWMSAELTGETDPLKIKRSRCAGSKAMWNEEFDGLPAEEFLVRLEPRLEGLRSRLYTETVTADKAAGTLSRKWARKLGLPEGTIVTSGSIDAHVGAVGGGVEAGVLIKVMGTSTCDMLVAPKTGKRMRLVRGICGQVDGSIVPGMTGFEAGQSAFGDIYAWFKNVLVWPLGAAKRSKLLDAKTKQAFLAEIEDAVLPELSKAAAKVPVSESGLLAVDWMNGRRTPDANQALSGALLGLTLGSDAPRIFRALVEATAFGSKAIVERFRREGLGLRSTIAVGGVAKKSPFVMQVVADVLDMPIQVAKSEQTVALGAAMFAAAAAGIHRNVAAAQKAMGGGIEKTYVPNKANAKKYAALYEKYLAAGKFIEKEL